MLGERFGQIKASLQGNTLQRGGEELEHQSRGLAACQFRPCRSSFLGWWATISQQLHGPCPDVFRRMLQLRKQPRFICAVRDIERPHRTQLVSLARVLLELAAQFLVYTSHILARSGALLKQ